MLITARLGNIHRAARGGSVTKACNRRRVHTLRVLHERGGCYPHNTPTPAGPVCHGLTPWRISNIQASVKTPLDNIHIDRVSKDVTVKWIYVAGCPADNL